MNATTILLIYPIIAAIAWRLGGIGAEGSITKKICKPASFALTSLPLLLAYYLHTNSLTNTLLLSFIIIPAIIFRRQIADSEDFPHRFLINLSKKQFINFDWLIGKWMTREKAAKADFPVRQNYKMASFSLNKIVISLPLYIGLALFAFSFWPLLNAALNSAFGAVYRYSYDIFDYGKRAWPIHGHGVAETAIGLFLGAIDSLLFHHVILLSHWDF